MKQGFKKAGFVLLASWLMSTAIPAFAQDNDAQSSLPEVEIDGSVLQTLAPADKTEKAFAPVKLVPTPGMEREAAIAEGRLAPSPSDIDKTDDDTVTPIAEIQAPVPLNVPLTEDSSLEPIASAPPVALTIPAGTELDNIDEPKMVVAASSASVASPVPDAPIVSAEEILNAKPETVATMKVGKISKSVDLARDDSRPEIKSKTVTIKEKEPAPQKVEEVMTPQAPPPVTALTPVAPHKKEKEEVAAIAAPSKPKEKPPVPVADASDLVKPPMTMAETANIKAPVAKPVVFPVKTSVKAKGELNPSIAAAAQTPTAPAELHQETSKALQVSMQQNTQQNDDDGKQDNPEVLYKDVPLPRPRPSVTIASAEFVKQARRTYEDTYKVIRHDGDRMPAVSKDKVASEPLPPGRLSVADIASDPLASQLVAMSPNDVANALNKISPAAGASAAPQDEVVRSTHVRIVRETGNWVSRKDPAKVAQAETAPILPPSSTQTTTQIASAAPVKQESPAATGAATKDRYTINFKSGETDLPSTSFSDVDKGIVSALKTDSTARVEIIAYASADAGKENNARRTSLSRALSIRSYLISKGIDATRMDVHAMGMEQDAKIASDKVEMILLPTNKS